MFIYGWQERNHMGFEFSYLGNEMYGMNGSCGVGF